MTYYVYIMASASHALYTGVTNDIERRVVEHREAKLPRFSARYKTRNLVYMEIFGDIRAAIAREKQIKGWLRMKKLALINSANPQWSDLSSDWPSCKGLISARAHGVSPAAGQGVVPVIGKGVILSGAKNPSEGFVPEIASAKNTSEDFDVERPSAKNSSKGITEKKTHAKRPATQNTRRGSSLRSE